VGIAAAWGADARAPMLSLVRRQPLTIGGSGFRPAERVLVRAADARIRVRASRLGRFRAVLGGDRCTDGVVVAVGSRGDRAALRLPRALCPPA
jgi:hypothetical protein